MDIPTIRQKYPQYQKVDDQTLADGLYRKYYADSLSQDDFYKKINFKPQSKLDKVGSAVRGGLAAVGKGVDELGARVGKASENAYKDIGEGVKQMQRGSQPGNEEFVPGALKTAGGAVGAVLAPLSGELATAEKGIGEGLYRARGGMSLEKGMGANDERDISRNREKNYSFLDTKLSPDKEKEFQQWKAKYAPRDSGFDYDLRGAFLKGYKPSADTGHFPDEFKKPNHPTFSNQSRFAKDYPQFAGSWAKDNKTYIPPKDIDIAEIHKAGEETAQGEGEKWAALASMIGGPEAARPNMPLKSTAEPIPPRPTPQAALPAPPQRLALPAPKEVPQGIMVNQRGQAVPASPYSTKNPATGLPTGQTRYAPNEPIPPRTQADRIKEAAASVAPQPKAVTPKVKPPAVKGRPAAESFSTGDELDRLLENQQTRMGKATRSFNRENAPVPEVSDFGRKVREATEGMFKAAKAPKGALRAEAINEEAAKLANVLKQMEKAKGSLTSEQVQTVKAALAEARRAREESLAEEVPAQKKSPPPSSKPPGAGEPLRATESEIKEDLKPHIELDTQAKMDESKWLQEELIKKEGRDAAIDMEMRKRTEAAEKDGVTPEIADKLYKWKESGGKTPLTPKEKALYNKHIKAINDMQDKNYKFKIEYLQKQEDARLPKGQPKPKREPFKPRPDYVHKMREDKGAFEHTNLPGGGRGLTRKTSSWKGTVFWALEDAKGGRQIAWLKPAEGKTIKGQIMQQGKPQRNITIHGTTDIKPGTQIKLPDGRTYTIKESMTQEREVASGEKYSTNLLKNSAEDAAHGQKVVDNIKTLDAIKERYLKKGLAYQGDKPPKGMSEPMIPQLRGTYFDDRLTEALNDWYGKNGGTAEAFFNGAEKVNNMMTRWMFINNLIHKRNEIADYLIGRADENFSAPMGILKYIKRAAKHVDNFDPIYRQWMEDGGAPKYPSALKTKIYGQAIRQANKDLYSKEGASLLKAWGLKTADAKEAVLNASQSSLWRTSDIVRVARYEELMDKGLTSQQAIAKLSEYTGRYKPPSRIGEKTLNKVMGEEAGGKASRFLGAAAQKNPFFYFTRWRYDVLKSWALTAKSIPYGQRKELFGRLLTMSIIFGIDAYATKRLVRATLGEDAANRYVPMGSGMMGVPMNIYNAAEGATGWRKALTGGAAQNPLGAMLLGNRIQKPEDLLGVAHPFSDIYYPIKNQESPAEAMLPQFIGGYFKK